MGVIYFLICVRKHESNLPANIVKRFAVQQGRKHNDREKNVAF